MKTILRFHQFPFWDPYECGGHPAWAALESDPIVVSPWLPGLPRPRRCPSPSASRSSRPPSGARSAAGCSPPASRAASRSARSSSSPWRSTAGGRCSSRPGTPGTCSTAFCPGFSTSSTARSIPPTPARARAPRRRARGALPRDDGLRRRHLPRASHGVPARRLRASSWPARRARGARCARSPRSVPSASASSAPKLLPLYEQLQRYPRHIGSEEAIWPQDIVKILTWRVGDLRATTSFTNGMWHEWGLYLGWLGLGLLVAGVAASRGHARAGAQVGRLRDGALRHRRLSPAHAVAHLPPACRSSSSQHVPSRWLYPAVAALACAAVSGGERWLARAGERRALLRGASSASRRRSWRSTWASSRGCRSRSRS